MVSSEPCVQPIQLGQLLKTLSQQGQMCQVWPGIFVQVLPLLETCLHLPSTMIQDLSQGLMVVLSDNCPLLFPHHQWSCLCSCHPWEECRHGVIEPTLPGLALHGHPLDGLQWHLLMWSFHVLLLLLLALEAIWHELQFSLVRSEIPGACASDPAR